MEFTPPGNNGSPPKEGAFAPPPASPFASPPAPPASPFAPPGNPAPPPPSPPPPPAPSPEALYKFQPWEQKPAAPAAPAPAESTSKTGAAAVKENAKKDKTSETSGKAKRIEEPNPTPPPQANPLVIALVFSAAAFAGGWFVSRAMSKPQKAASNESCAVKNIISNPKAEGLPNCTEIGSISRTEGRACVLYVQNTFSGSSPTRVEILARAAAMLLRHSLIYGSVDADKIAKENSTTTTIDGNNIIFSKRVVPPGAVVQFYIPAVAGRT